MKLLDTLKGLFPAVAQRQAQDMNKVEDVTTDYDGGKTERGIQPEGSGEVKAGNITQSVLSTVTSLNDNSDIKEKIIKLFPDFQSINLSEAPGLVGAICHDLARWEHRSLPELRPMAALNIVSLLCKQRLNGDGKQLSVFMIGIAPSASGKGDHIDYTNFLLSNLGLGDFVYSDPRSDKSIYLDLFESGGLVYLVDEVQGLFSGMLSKSSSEYTQSMLSLLMKLNTASSVTLPGNLQRELRIDNPTKLMPFLGFTGYSTPSELSFILNEKNIHSGLLGRFVFFPGTHLRRPKRKNVSREINEDVLNRCMRIAGEKSPVLMSDTALHALHMIDALFDQDEFLNHSRLGAIFARGSEQVKRNSYLIGAEKGLVEKGDVLYALSLFVNSVESFLSPNQLDSLHINHEAEALEVAKDCAQEWVLQSVLANKMTKNRSVFRTMHKNSPRSHYKVIQSLIERGALIAEGKKVKVA
ncbi:hypothetical protein [Pseudoalteromonas piscicida]|uniref:hypothetical protein n=1 Tax=Pseudoalteromonas piscicida TaxID=43662 RepID=UPI000E35F398|nr:hypothetical protein [Pseudoalteromonas piscicida]AXQ99182.1 hypothetical protein D0N37_16585 [Pseudoalteromonas piscicida]